MLRGHLGSALTRTAGSAARVPVLLLINGLPASGKSTLARRYGTDHPLTLVLDIDLVRAMLGGWLDQPFEAGLLARGLAVEMARAHLRTGRDVVVPQFLGRLEFVLALAGVAEQEGARFVEVALVADPDDAARRFAARTAADLTSQDRDAAALLELTGGLASFAELHRRLLAVVAARPATCSLPSTAGQVDQAYAALLAALPA